ncbi:MAG: polymerase [Phycisphaerales bacterium]|nr:polymerase [Phycisphaerales bacterium]
MRKTFFILDGHAQIYRAYFAPFRDLTSPTGEPTKGTFVFTQMLLNLIEQRKPDYLAMVIDSSDETVFRKDIYPDYKANREKPKDDFKPQADRILRIVRDAGIPIFVKPGFEADDLLATMAKNLCDKGVDTYLVSKDKDLRQVLSDCVFMYDPATNETIDPIKMEEKLGYGPLQAVEIQSLMGDKIDNVPGIPGVGEKTALELIRQFGTADEVVRRASEIKKPKLRENVEKYGAANVPVARSLVTLKTDVDFDFSAEQCAFTGLNQDALRVHLAELGFKNLIAKLGGPAPSLAPSPEAKTQAKFKPAYDPFGAGGLFGNHDQVATVSDDVPTMETSANLAYNLVDTDEKFDAFLAELKQQKAFAVDTETDDLGAMKSNLVGLSFSWKEGTGHYVPVMGPAGCSVMHCDKVLNALKSILEDESIGKVGHNIKYDQLVLRNAGITLRGLKMDTMVAAFLIDSSRMQYGIDRLAADLLNFQKIPTSDLLGKGKAAISMNLVELRKIANYASEDVDVTWRLYELLAPKLAAEATLQWLSDTVETPLVDVLAEMEFNGIGVDPAVLKEQSDVLAGRIEIIREDIHKEAGGEFNIDSPKQLEKVLFIDLKLPTAKKTKTGYSTDVQVLEKLALQAPIARKILDYRSMVKLKNTYLDSLTEYVNKKTGRIHTSFNQTGAATGRLSSSDPNLQNIPIRTDEGRRIRLAFVPGDPKTHVLLTADYSQIELRLLAHFTQEPGLLSAFKNDEDIHKTVAAEVFGVPLAEVTREQRNSAKTVNFGIVYGVTAFGLSARIEGLSVGDAKGIIERYHARFPGIQTFFDKCVEEAKSKGFVETILGRRRPIPDINSAVINMRNYAERAAINSVVQGSAADLIKVAMVNIYRKLTSENHPSKLLLQVHDELVFETPIGQEESEAAFVRTEMNAALSDKLSVPLKVEVGWAKNWQEVK